MNNLGMLAVYIIKRLKIFCVSMICTPKVSNFWGAYHFLKGISFDKIIASDLIRAVETAENAIPDCSCETSPLLREINVGTLASRPLSVVTDEQRERIAKCGYVEFDGESKEQFSGRIRQVMKELEMLNCETVALFTHRGWMLEMLDAVVGSFLPRKHVQCKNCAIAIFEFTDGIWQLHSWLNLS